MQLPTEVPVMTLRNVILFPQAMLPLHIFEPRYRKMLADVLAGERMFAVAMQRADCTREAPSAVAGLGLVRVCVTNRDGTSNLILQGLSRVKLGKTLRYRPYRLQQVNPLVPVPDTGVVVQALTAKVLELAGERLKQGLQNQDKAEIAKVVPEGCEQLTLQAFEQALRQLANADDAEQLADLVSATLLHDARQRQIILETPRLVDRLRFLVRFLRRATFEPDQEVGNE